MKKQIIRRSTPQQKKDTLDDVFLAYILTKKIEGRAEETLDGYTYSYTRFCEFCGFDETAMPNEVNFGCWNLWILSMESEMKPASVNHHIKQLRGFIHYLMKNGYCEEFDIHEVKTQEPMPKTFTDDELKALLRAPRNLDNFVEVRMWVMTNLVCATGARAGSVRSVRMCDVDLQHNFINFPHTKNRKALRLPISKALQPILTTYINEWRSDADEEDYLFPDIGNEQMTQNALRCAFSRYCRRRGVQKTSFHALRHNFAKAWILNDGSPVELMTVLSHSHYDTTKRYVRLWGEDLQEGFEEHSLLDNATKPQNRLVVKRNTTHR